MQKSPECSDDLTVLDYFNMFNRRKIPVILIVAVSVIAAGLISYFSPKIYRARAVIMPAAPQQKQSDMRALASRFGITSSRTANASEIVSLLRSNILMERVIRNHDLMKVFFGKDGKDPGKTSNIWNGIRYLKKSMYRVNDNKRDGIIELSLEYTDPEVAADVLGYFLSELTDYMSSEAKRVAETNREYLESLIDKNTDPLIKQKIYTLIAQQIETSMMAEVKENFAFKILDPPRAPDRKIRPNIRRNMVLAFVISLFAGVFLVFFLEYIRRVNPKK